MTDVYSRITELDADAIEPLARALELSATDPRHRVLVESYLREARLGPNARVLEIGCGTGAIARIMAKWPGIGEVVGVDPSPDLLSRARYLSSAYANLSYQVADGRELGLPPASFDGVVVHRVLSHVPQPERVVAEALRVLRSGGKLVVFEGDYSTLSLAAGDSDPLEACVAAFVPAHAHDRWIARRLFAMARDAGFAEASMKSHGYLQIEDPEYMLSIADRGADLLVASGRIGSELGEALKAEARRRVRAGTFYGHIAYSSLIAQKP